MGGEKVGKLYVFSEINCLPYLVSVGLRPAAFFTDFKKYKQHIAIEDNVVLLILLIGSCRVNKNEIMQFLETVRVNPEGMGVSDIILITDERSEWYNDYYYMPDSLNTLVFNQNGHVVKKSVDILEILQYEESDVCKTLLSDYDKGLLTLRNISPLESEQWALEHVQRVVVPDLFKKVRGGKDD